LDSGPVRPGVGSVSAFLDGDDDVDLVFSVHRLELFSNGAHAEYCEHGSRGGFGHGNGLGVFIELEVSEGLKELNER
jgi:hypothetical protein